MVQKNRSILNEICDFLLRLEKESLSPSDENRRFFEFLNELLQKVSEKPTYEKKSHVYRFVFLLTKLHKEVGTYFREWLKPSRDLKPVFNWFLSLKHLPEPISLSVCVNLFAITLDVFDSYAYTYFSPKRKRKSLSMDQVAQRLSEVLLQLFGNYVKQYVHDPNAYVQYFHHTLTDLAFLNVVEKKLIKETAFLAQGFFKNSPNCSDEFLESVGPAYLHALQVAKWELNSLLTSTPTLLDAFENYRLNFFLTGAIRNYVFLVLFDSIANQPDFQVRLQFLKAVQDQYLDSKNKVWKKENLHFDFPAFLEIGKKAVPRLDSENPLYVIGESSFYVVQSILALKEKPYLVRAFLQYFDYGLKCFELLKNGINDTQYVCPTYKKRLESTTLTFFCRVSCVFEWRLKAKESNLLPEDDDFLMVNLSENVKILYQHLRSLSPNALVAFNLLLHHLSIDDSFFKYFVLPPQIFTKFVLYATTAAREINEKFPSYVEYGQASDYVIRMRDDLQREVETLVSRVKNEVKRRLLPPLNAGSSLV